MTTEAVPKTIEVGGESFRVQPGVYEPHYVCQDDLLYKLSDLARCESVLDMGTGTGVLSVLWAANFSSIKHIVAVDKNPAAVENARLNAERFRDRITVVKSDLFDEFESDPSLLQKIPDGKFDAIIFNGPHLDTGNQKENEKWEEKLGDRNVSDLCDFGLLTAARFFEQAGSYLKDDGFIVYTFSDYCQVERLFELISQCEAHRYLATPLSILEFTSRELDKVGVPAKMVNLWYNVKVKHLPKMSLSELTRGFRKAIVTLAGYYVAKKKTDTAHMEEHREKTKSLLKCLTEQIDNLIKPDEWLVSGFSLPDWHKKRPDHTLLTSAGRGVKTLKSDFTNNLNRLVNIMRDMPGSFLLLIDYLSSPDAPGIIEAHLAKRDRASYVTGVNKLSFEFAAAGLLTATTLRDLMLSERASVKELQLHITDIDKRIKYKEVARQFGLESVTKVGHNMWLNFSVVKMDEKPVTHIRFTKINYPMGSLSGSVYFFSALEPTQENNDLIAALEEVIGIANDNLLNPIWPSSHYVYALRSAIAAIMSRNMSHNLGSHVLWHLSQKLEHAARELQPPPGASEL